MGQKNRLNEWFIEEFEEKERREHPIQGKFIFVNNEPFIYPGQDIYTVFDGKDYIEVPESEKKTIAHLLPKYLGGEKENESSTPLIIIDDIKRRIRRKK